MNVNRLLSSIWIVIISLTYAEGKEWQGIKPLHSTRADVERVLGEPNAKFGRYQVGNEVADFFYSAGPCSNGWNVPRDTVISITIYYIEIRTLSDLKLDLKEFERVPDPVTTNHIYYTNRKEGTRYDVVESPPSDYGLILQLYHEPTSDDEKLFYCHQSQPKTNGGRCDGKNQKNNGITITEKRIGSGLRFCDAYSASRNRSRRDLCAGRYNN